ncbi:MAG: hypothetical protein HZC51_05600 [Nitrospirae bacterium]|nr:hypothetical protein [Nitrospirota bacterium]
MNIGDNTGRERKFYPDYLFEILVVCLLVLEAVLALSFVFAPHTGRPVDFSRNFQPLPEWYFMGLYQLLKYFPGKWAFMGVVLIPCGALCLMFALPFIEKTPSRRLRDRLPSAAVASSLLAALTVLTVLAYM